MYYVRSIISRNAFVMAFCSRLINSLLFCLLKYLLT